MKRNFLNYLCLPVALIISVFIVAACNKAERPATKELTAEEKQKKEGFEALNAKKAEYITVPAKEQLVREPYSKKKFLVYGFDPQSKDKNDAWMRNYFGTDKMGSTLYSKQYEKLEFKLATNPVEVGIIALIPECKEVKAGSYGSAATAFQEQCELILIDTELSAVVYRKTFAGKLDSSKTVSSGESSVTARVDGMEIIDFLDSLAVPKSGKK